MTQILYITLAATLVCGLGTSAGALLVTVYRHPGGTIMGSIVGIAGGLMMSIVTYDLVPEAVARGGMTLTVGSLIGGIAFAAVVDTLLSPRIERGFGPGMKSGVLLVVALTAHNFPEGLAIGAGFAGTLALGLELSIVIGLHDVPEGAAVAAAFLGSRLRRRRIVAIAAATAVPTAVGAFIGAAVGALSDGVFAVCLGFAAGTMLYIVCGELIPQSKSISKGVLSTLSIMVGILLGFMIAVAIG